MPKSKIRIAVSGMKGSFSEEAALKYIQKQKILQYEIVYRTNMEEALTALDQDMAMLCVIPVYNKIQGPVMPAMQAMGRHDFEVIENISLKISFSLLAQKGVQKKNIHAIAHYIVAANQCRIFLKKNFPKIKEIQCQDSALAAEELSKGVFGNEIAVIAPKRCVKIYPGLHIITENIEDDPENFTDFILVKK